MKNGCAITPEVRPYIGGHSKILLQKLELIKN